MRIFYVYIPNWLYINIIDFFYNIKINWYWLAWVNEYNIIYLDNKKNKCATRVKKIYCIIIYLWTNLKFRVDKKKKNLNSYYFKLIFWTNRWFLKLYYVKHSYNILYRSDKYKEYSNNNTKSPFERKHFIHKTIVTEKRFEGYGYYWNFVIVKRPFCEVFGLSTV